MSKKNMGKKTKSGLWVLIVIIVMVISLVVLYLATSKNSDKSFEISNYSNNGNPNGISTHYDKSLTANFAKNNKKLYIAALYIEGTIENSNNTYNQKWILQTIDSLKYDNNNVAIAIYINTPGGGVYQADEVYLALKNYKSTGKKIYVYMGPMAASGGYYISCAADEIYANRNTLTGSIGVISSQVYDLTELFYNLGIESTTIYSGDNKNMGNINEPFTDDQQEIMQEICDECYEQFLEIVKEERNFDDKKARKLADGRIYSANQALKNGLIDKIGDWNSMIEDLSMAVVGNMYCNVKTFKYEKKLTFMEEMFTTFSQIKPLNAKENASVPLYMYK